MYEYPKIQTLYDRDKTTFKVIPGQLCLKEFGLVDPSQWIYTEKVDGVNVRVILHPDDRIEFRGRTDASQVPQHLRDVLEQMFPLKVLRRPLRESAFPIVVYGEGYGIKIQKGGKYRKEGVSFRIFDIRIGDWWLSWEDVRGIAGSLDEAQADIFKFKALDICTVPILPQLPYLPTTAQDLDALFSDVAMGSPVAWVEKGEEGVQAEGIVARTVPELHTRTGQRLMFKLKYRDF